MGEAGKEVRAEGLPDWAKELFIGLEIGPESSVDEVFTKAGRAADNLAPNTRSAWKWILIAQVAAVMTPGTWLILDRLNWPTSLVALFVTLSSLAIITACWWLRWRGMQQNWARTRVIAEICRSLKSSKGAGSKTTIAALDMAPDLRALAKYISGDSEPAEANDLEEAKADYAKHRIGDQADYYQRKLKEAEATRNRLGRVVTMSLDSSLFLAIAGVVISWNSGGLDWLRFSTSDWILGFLGMFLPLLALASQLMGSYQELNRRVGRYAQILQFLKPAASELKAARDRVSLYETQLRVERCLLGEVVDWYYQTEHAMMYYRGSNVIDNRKALARASKKKNRAGRLITVGLHGGMNFLFKVVLGRILVVGLSVVFTTAWITFRAKSESPEFLSSISLADGRLLSSAAQKNAGELWQPSAERSENGLIMIVHGLSDGVGKRSGESDEAHWMVQLQKALEGRFPERRPEIVLVDWESAADPSNNVHTKFDRATQQTWGDMYFPGEARKLLHNVTTIRPVAEAIGEQVGFKLARGFRLKKLRKDQPIHLIGHSAGGFVVTHAALVLMDLGVDPEQMQVTLLDTPMARDEDLAKVASRHRVDFFKTSRLAQKVPDATAISGEYRLVVVPPREGMSPYKEAHSYAYEWYIETVLRTDGSEGFNRSIFVEH